jgi:ferredoxin-NADP reductase
LHVARSASGTLPITSTAAYAPRSVVDARRHATTSWRLSAKDLQGDPISSYIVSHSFVPASTIIVVTRMQLEVEMPWRTVRAVSIREETPTAKSFRFAFDEPVRHLAGQHYVVRLTAPGGYTTSRSYSVASAPDGSAEFELTVERLEDGEVSTFLHDVVEPGDEIDVLGPIGGWFVWDGMTPAVLVGGGSGVVPLMAMLRLARATGRADLVRLLISVRTPEDLYYRGEIEGPQTTVVYTRSAPSGSRRPAGRMSGVDVSAALLRGATAYVCGSTGFANAASDLLVAAGVPAETIRVERFGPSGPQAERESTSR